MIYTPNHPGMIDALRPTKVGRFYVQPAVEYIAGRGFTTVPVVRCWQVRTIDGNKLETETDTRLFAISEAHKLEAAGHVHCDDCRATRPREGATNA